MAGLQPMVIPTAATPSLLASWTLLLSSMARPPELADDPDDDGDGVADIEDICALTLVSEPAPDDWMERRYWTDATGSFVDPIGRDPRYTLIDTGGCSASQVIEALELGDGHQRSGLAEGVLVAWGEYMESIQADE